MIEPSDAHAPVPPPQADHTTPLDKRATSLIHHAYRPPAGFDAVQPGVHKASTVFFENTAALRSREWKDKTSYTYGLHGTPTTYALEERLATLEGGLQTLLVPSGLAAIALVGQSLLQPGDEVLVPDNAYAPNKDFTRVELARWGIACRVYDPMDPDALAGLISERTRLLWLEAAGSVTLEFPDLPALLMLARRHPHLVVALDNTWGAGLAFNPFDLGVPHSTDTRGVDVTIHALTKYPSGGADVLMGSVITRDAALHMRLKLAHMRLGLGVGANDAESLLRSLPTLPLRYAAHDVAAREVAQWWLGRSEVSQVLHPAVATSPGHGAWARLTERAAGLVSVVFDGDRYNHDRVCAFVDALKLFRIGYSWGGPVSLVMPYGLKGLRQCGPFAGRTDGTLVRFSVGLESTNDLIADLSQALARLA